MPEAIDLLLKELKLPTFSLRLMALIMPAKGR